MRGAASLSPCGLYRYRLSRGWDLARPPLAVVMLNPSTADATRDDPTIRRCIGFALRGGYGGVEVMNLFAFRATAPADLKAAPDPIGPDNDHHLRDLFAHYPSVLAAWGAHGAYRGRAEAVMRLATDLGTELSCLGRTAHGQPRHPLYVKGDRAILSYAASRT